MSLNISKQAAEILTLRKGLCHQRLRNIMCPTHLLRQIINVVNCYTKFSTTLYIFV